MRVVKIARVVINILDLPNDKTDDAALRQKHLIHDGFIMVTFLLIRRMSSQFRLSFVTLSSNSTYTICCGFVVSAWGQGADS